MINISCQQLTEGIKTTQRLKNEYDSVPSDNKENVKCLSEIKTTVETLHDRLMIDCAGKEIFILDYKSLELFAENNCLDLEWMLTDNNSQINIGFHNGRVSFLSIFNEKALDLDGVENFKELSFFTFYNCRAKIGISFENLQKLDSIELDYSDLLKINLSRLPHSVRELKLNNISLYDLSFTKRLPRLKWLEIGHTKCFESSNKEKNTKIIEELKDRGVEVYE